VKAMRTDTQSVNSKTSCSSRIIDAWTLVMGVNIPVTDAWLTLVTEPRLTVLNQQVSEGMTPPTPASCDLVGYASLSHLPGLSSESYLAEKQEEIDREDT
jgi:long-subunit fatty acid transport protein